MKKDFKFLLFTLTTSFGFVFFPTYKNTHLISEYREAKKNKDCLHLQSLYQNKDFSLKDVARIQAYKLCPNLEDSKYSWKNFPPWLQKHALESWFHRASQKKETENFIQASFTLSQFTPIFEEKIRYSLHALKIARKINSPRVKEITQYLYSVSPSHKPQPQTQDYIKVARDFKKRFLLKESIIYYRKTLNSKTATPLEKQESFKQLAWLYKRTKQKKRYLRAISQYQIFQERTKNQSRKFKENTFREQISVGRKLWNADKNQKALNVFQQIIQKKPSQNILAEVYWLMGKIYEDQQDVQNALLHFKKGKEHTSHQNKEMKEKILWSLVWTLKQELKYEDALTYLNELTEDGNAYNPQFIYWKAQILEYMNQKSDSKKFFEELAQKSPLSFHGMLAHHKLNQPIQLDLITINPRKKDPYQLVDDLFEAEEKSLVLGFVKHTLEEHKKNKSLKKENLLQLFRRSSNLGIYLPFFRFVGNLSFEEKSKFLKNYAHTLFPLIFEEDVQKASTLFHVPQEIIYSIIRQESAFNPRALSPAHAIGLMQILPSVARETAKQKAIAFRNSYDLYNPQKNIIIGTAYFQKLTQRYGNHLILNVASYNAGPRSVNRWLEKFSTQDPVEFIQNIPYRETQNYVRLIIRNYIIYKTLQSKNYKIDFPDEILSLPHSTSLSFLNLSK